MNILKNNLSGVIFWLLISVISSVTLFFYFNKENSDLISLSFTPLLSFLAFILGSLKKAKLKLFPSNWIEYIIENILFFLLFILTLFLLNEDFAFVKIIAFLIMTAVGIYNTVSLLKYTRNS
jgi:hypothetical protein